MSYQQVPVESAQAVCISTSRLVRLVSLVAVVATMLWAVAAGAQGTGGSLRFYGNGFRAPDMDRVVVSIDSPHRPVDVGSGDFTVEWWMRALQAENVTGDCTNGADNWIFGNIILDRDVWGRGDWGDWGVSVAGGVIAFGVDNGSTGVGICGSTMVADGQWHHVAVTRRAVDGRLQIYVDGALDGQAASGPLGDLSYRDGRPTSFPDDPTLVLGAEKHDAGASFLSYSGWLEELRVSTVLRYTADFTPSTVPFVADVDTAALYHFDEGSGDVINDSSDAVGGPSHGVRQFGGNPAGPLWSSETPFTGPSYPLSVSLAGTGTGRVTSTPLGIDCGTDCSAIYPAGTVVVLTATPDPAAAFSVWGGDPDCLDGQVVMSSAVSCSATFDTSLEAPVAVDDVASTPENTSVVIDVLANDTDPNGDPLSVVAVTQGAGGSVFNNGSSVTYLPESGFLGIDTFSYSVSDGTSDPSSAQVTVEVLPSDLVLALGFEDGSGPTARDSSGKGNHGLLVGATWDADGVFGGAMSFDGGDHLQVTDATTLDLSDELTFSAWINPQSLNGIRIVGNKSETVSPTNYYLGLFGNEVAFGFFDGSWREHVTSGAGLQSGEWVHIAATYSDAADRVMVYVDGVQRLSASQNRSLVANGMPLLIGASAPGQETFRGRIDELRLYNRVLSQSEIQADMNAPVDPAVGDTFTLSVSLTGTGSGSVSSLPTGIDCGANCSAGFETGTEVTLTATPDAGSVFAGWSGAGDCDDGQVTLTADLACVAQFDTEQFTLAVSTTGTGAGTVTSAPAGIDCGSDCSEAFDTGTEVILTPVAEVGSVFVGWSGDPDCGDGSVTLSADVGCSARFDAESYTLSVALTGAGQGTVTSTPAGIDCGVDCSEAFTYGTQVTLAASADSGSVFAGFHGDPDCVDGQVSIGADIACSARFEQEQYSLSVTRTGSGSGTVTSLPAGIECGADCGESFVVGTVVTLTATPVADSIFAGWSGDPDCADGVVTMSAAVSCVATFETQIFTLTVWRSGSGSGTVSSTPIGIDCGNDCSESYTVNEVVTLTPTPAADSVFVGWSGDPDCSDGVVTLSTNINCTAQFDQELFSLTLVPTGTGSGTVTSVPVGIDCGSDCAEMFPDGTGVTLSAVAAPGSTFAGWGGAADCADGQVTMSSDLVCSARFDAETLLLDVFLTGGGSGSVTSSPAGISCGPDCSEEFMAGTTVTLIATPAPGSAMVGWEGHADCEDGVVTLSVPLACTARFELETYSLSVLRTGTGAGSVASSPAGIDCGGDCGEIYAAGTPVTLSAAPAVGSIFVGWGGDADCADGQLVMDGDRGCIAVFDLMTFALSVNLVGGGSGSVTSTPAGIDCGSDCSELFPFGANVALVAAPAVGSLFAGWSGAADCSDGQVSMVAPATCTASFEIEELAPVAADDAVSTPVDTAVVIDVLANDSDPNGDFLTVVAASPGGNGDTVVNPDNTVTYTPDPGFAGTDLFSYTVSDDFGLTDVAEVTVVVESSSLELAYGFEEGSGSTVADFSPNGNDGTIAGASWTPMGRFGGGLSLDGNDYIRVSDAASLDMTDELTLQAWINPDRVNGFRVILNKSDTVWPTNYYLAVYSGELVFGFYANGWREHFTSGLNLPTRTWTHVAATFDDVANRVVLFVDGIEVLNQYQNRSLITNGRNMTMGGSAPGVEAFDGLLDEIRIYSQALTAAEIAVDMNTPVDPTLP